MSEIGFIGSSPRDSGRAKDAPEPQNPNVIRLARFLDFVERTERLSKPARLRIVVLYRLYKHVRRLYLGC